MENEARARALAQAQEELRGRPLTLEPGAPARLNVDPATDIPFGFYDRPGFEQFSRRLYEPLRAVDKDAQLVLEGSGVAGRRFDRLISHEPTGAPFGVGPVSDYDVGIVSDQLLQRARQLRIPTSEPLTGAQLVALGLEDLASRRERPCWTPPVSRTPSTSRSMAQRPRLVHACRFRSDRTWPLAHAPNIC